MLQVRQNLITNSTGQLSLVTALVITCGNLVRTFTSAVLYMEDPEGDCLGLSVMIVTLCLNSVILLQVLLYQRDVDLSKSK